MPEEEQIIAAQVILNSPDGKSLLNYPFITKSNLQQVHVNSDTVNKVVEVLHQAGFSSEISYPTISITGKKALFEKTFQLHFASTADQAGVYVEPLNKAVIPESLEPWVADVVFGEPVETFK